VDVWEPNGDLHNGYLVNTGSDGRFVIDPRGAGDVTDRVDYGMAYYFGTGTNCYVGAGSDAGGLGVWQAQAFAGEYSSNRVSWEVHWFVVHLTH
jgi:hypothetical protein